MESNLPYYQDDNGNWKGPGIKMMHKMHKIFLFGMNTPQLLAAYVVIFVLSVRYTRVENRKRAARELMEEEFRKHGEEKRNRSASIESCGSTGSAFKKSSNPFEMIANFWSFYFGGADVMPSLEDGWALGGVRIGGGKTRSNSMKSPGKSSRSNKKNSKPQAQAQSQVHAQSQVQAHSQSSQLRNRKKSGSAQNSPTMTVEADNFEVEELHEQASALQAKESPPVNTTKNNRKVKKQISKQVSSSSSSSKGEEAAPTTKAPSSPATSGAISPATKQQNNPNSPNTPTSTNPKSSSNHKIAIRRASLRKNTNIEVPNMNHTAECDMSDLDDDSEILEKIIKNSRYGEDWFIFDETFGVVPKGTLILWKDQIVKLEKRNFEIELRMKKRGGLPPVRSKPPACSC
ncbi:hypothetical protein ScalyP_jg4713 [Parmales sp. scaly parma]|nr:hypothetical protein ScalyP_jg4713 [Parmales sp. scaly parma]